MHIYMKIKITANKSLLSTRRCEEQPVFTYVMPKIAELINKPIIQNVPQATFWRQWVSQFSNTKVYTVAEVV